ncbi:hypothetical protein ACFQ1M_00745 [Sungkyunkwania multivorans]|uniref:TfoX N-terminal domain-containing protein n=1 Tax=Sungkyunkwania multivorans TaxID=1173618 RepID=A0ABW3CV54_9FLAO
MTRDEALKIYDQIVAACPKIERKGKTMPYTSANGYMFSQLNKTGEIGIRLSKTEGKAFMQKYPSSGPFRSYGAVMKDYVLIPEELLTNTDLMASYLEKAHQYVLTLPPK